LARGRGSTSKTLAGRTPPRGTAKSPVALVFAADPGRRISNPKVADLRAARAFFSAGSVHRPRPWVPQSSWLAAGDVLGAVESSSNVNICSWVRGRRFSDQAHARGAWNGRFKTRWSGCDFCGGIRRRAHCFRTGRSASAYPSPVIRNFIIKNRDLGGRHDGPFIERNQGRSRNLASTGRSSLGKAGMAHSWRTGSRRPLRRHRARAKKSW